MNIITPDNTDFAQYMLEMEPQIKIVGAHVWRDQLAASIKNPEQLAGATLPWAKSHDKIRFRGGEVTVWAGINGHGKSMITSQVSLGLAAQGERICLASFEMRPINTLRRMLRQFSMTARPAERMAHVMSDWLDGKYWLYDQLGTVSPKVIYAMIRYCADKLKIKHIFIDSLMKCVGGEDDYNGQKNFVDTLTGLARDYNIHIHLVHHIRKADNENIAPGKFDVKGTGAITDLVDQVLVTWRNKAKERAREKGKEDEAQPDAMLICDKNRHGEWEGRIHLYFDPESLQYTSDSRRMPIQIDGGPLAARSVA